mmetsp:Transcript_14755/g.43469  ORF Transcript_14755/g.43469 Transcript_14755/m.43469 type:complete len:688 (+) Transcript_14755:2-2065(+)
MKRVSVALLLAATPAVAVSHVARVRAPRPAHRHARVASVAVVDVRQRGVGLGSSTARGRLPVMLEGGPPPEPSVEEEVFGEMEGELDRFDRLLKRLPTVAVGTSSNALVVLSSIFAWFVTPTRIPAAVTVGVAGAAGKQVGEKLRNRRRAVVPAAIAEMVNKDGLKRLDRAKVARLAERYDVPPELFEEQLRGVYARFLGALVDDEEVEPSDVSKLAALRRGLGLGWKATESIHVAEAASLAGEEAPGAELPEPLSKLLWASMTLFSTSRGSASADELLSTLGLSEARARGAVNEVSAPLYRAALAQAVGRYNRTQTPLVLQTVRKALNLPEEAAQAVHQDVYDSQLAKCLPSPGDDGAADAELSDETKALLSELEGVLQIRGAAQRVHARTIPLYRSSAAALLEAPTSVGDPGGAWAALALRQQGLALPTERAKAVLQEESRRIATARLEEAARLAAAGRDDEATSALLELTGWADLVGSLVQLAGWSGEAPARDLAERYLGALSLEPGLEEAAQRLLSGTGANLASSLPLLQSMLALGTPSLKAARDDYCSRLDRLLASAQYGESERKALDAAATQLGLPEPLARKLALDAYYGWLLDLTEGFGSRSSDAKAELERSAELRACLQLEPSAVGELYSNTEIDASVLSACCDALAPGSEYEAMETMQHLERALDARPGVVAQILRTS